MSDHLVDPKMVATVLAGIPEVRHDTLLDLINSSMRQPITVTESANPKIRLFYIAQRCLADEEGRSALMQAVQFLAPDTRQAVQLTRWLSPAAPLLNGQEEQRIEGLLRQCRVGNLPAIFHLSIGGGARVLPRALNDVHSVYSYLLDLNARPGGLPPHLNFVAHISRDLLDQEGPEAAELVRKLRTWLFQQRDELNRRQDAQAADQLDSLLHQQPPNLTRDDYPVSLIVQIDRLPTPNDHRDLHQVRHWRQFDQTRWCPERGEDQAVPMTEVADCVLALIREADENWAYDAAGPLTLEFVLSGELINLAVDQWPQPARHGLVPRALGADYEVVLRSDTRLRPKTRHGHWRRRWSHLLADRGNTFMVPIEGVEDLNALQDQLLREQSMVACVLSSPPDREPGRTELGIALDAGLPIMLWCRDTDRAGDFRVTVNEAIEAPKLKKLPKSLQHLRSSAHFCGNAGLLWDDPYHPIPEESPIVTPQ
ncbi:hypothetical protein OIE66_35355 [Nonomuraea sp. NBC_01738]|uniref:VMAP-C domain-containing protein n=1 Tax=Nonomuraea sp. NBC_01738 TaxID=2976003 RepID=UPI002E16574A|nr:hypothetical protein OIE66_35355 [Nonomuraea sp. NBC_01738]